MNQVARDEIFFSVAQQLSKVEEAKLGIVLTRDNRIIASTHLGEIDLQQYCNKEGILMKGCKGYYGNGQLVHF